LERVSRIWEARILVGKALFAGLGVRITWRWWRGRAGE